MFARKLLICLLAVFVLSSAAVAQDILPEDNGLWTYHTSPRYRPSDEHPLRYLAYAVHPVGWVARELVTRPLNYFIGSTEVTKSIFGFKEPYAHRKPECFSSDASTPDCRSIAPYNYDMAEIEEPIEEEVVASVVERQVYFPDVNFDFDKRQLNDLGKGRSRQIAALLEESPNLNIVLEGHTDYIGGDQYNESLGMDRAEAVRVELVAQGIPAERVSTVTFGKSKPVFAEEQDWARAVNRRVEIRLDEVEAVPAAE